MEKSKKDTVAGAAQGQEPVQNGTARVLSHVALPSSLRQQAAPKGRQRPRDHNKRRSSLVVYDQLVTFVAQRLVEGDDTQAKKALRIVKERFCEGSELLKELRVLNALVDGSVSSRDVAASVLREARLAVQRHDASRLEQEKSALVGAIVRELGGQSFFDARVVDYKTFATAQTLVNDWRSPSEANMLRTAEYEDTMIERLTEKRAVPGEDDRFPGADGFVVKVMARKLGDRYAGRLSPTQRRLVREFAGAADEAEVQIALRDVRRRATTALASAGKTLTEAALRGKADSVSQLIVAERDDDSSSEALARHMMYARLIDEVLSGNENDSLSQQQNTPEKDESVTS